jgi:hypothetical protein
MVYDSHVAQAYVTGGGGALRSHRDHKVTRQGSPGLARVIRKA